MTDMNSRQETSKADAAAINIAASCRDESGKPSSADNMGFQCCDDPILFQMRDLHHEFSMGLFTILDCLKIAEEEGYIPVLSDDWWLKIKIRYKK